MDISCKEAIKPDDSCENPASDTRTRAEDGESDGDGIDSGQTSSVQTLTTKLRAFCTTTTTSSSGQVSICSTREVESVQEDKGESSEPGKASQGDGMIPKDQRNLGDSGDPEEPYSLIEFADEKKILLSKMGHEFLFEYGGHVVGQEDTPHDDLDEAVLLDDEDSDDSSDLLDSDSGDDDDDVVSIPLRGRCIQYLRHAICQDPCYHCLKTSGPAKSSGKCKTIDAYSMDFKLKVLEWAYSKSIYSAGHHFNLERCVVRNWMMNEEKIFLLASSKGRRKWARYDSGKKGSTTRYSQANLDLRLVKGLGGLKVSGNGNGGSRS